MPRSAPISLILSAYVSASVLLLYMSLGFPKPAKEPNFLSQWVVLSTDERNYCTIAIDSQVMALSMVPWKGQQFLEELSG
jgi:hypothetical protein